MTLIDLALSRSKTVIIALVLIFVSGIIAYFTLPKESEPDVSMPSVMVLLRLDGVSPEDAERLLVRPMEQELRNLEGLKQMDSVSRESGADIYIEFDAGVDPQNAVVEVREKVDAGKAELPDNADEPIVNEMRTSRMMPIMVLNLGGPVPERGLYQLATELKEKIEPVPGVLEVELAGDREELLEVVVDPVAMEGYGLQQEDILNFVSRNNRLVAAGALQSETGRFPIKVPGVIESAEDMLSLPIKVDGDVVVRFSDIATVRRTYKDPETFARLNGTPAVALEVVKRAGANAIDVTDAVKEVIAQERVYWPPGLQIVASTDRSNEIRSQLSELTNNVIAAVLLVFIVLVGILGFRNAALVGIAVPGSFLGALMIMGIADLTINMVTMFGLLMAVGLLVDGAIVVTELADRRMAEGDSRRQAYAAAAKRMSWPIISSTATTLAAFVPLLAWPGMIGEFMRYLPITLITVLAMSLLMALLFLPALGGVFGKPGASSDAMRRDLIAAESGDLFSIGGFTGRYIRFLDKALRRPWRNLAVTTMALVGIYFAFYQFGLGQVLFPEVEQRFATVKVRARGDLSAFEKDALVGQVERRIIGMPEITSVYARTGAAGGGGNAAKDQIGNIRLTFTDWNTRRPAAEIMNDIKQRTDDIAGIVVDTDIMVIGPPTGRAIEIEFSSRFLEPLQDTVSKVRSALAEVNDLENIEDSRALPGIEWRIEVDRTKAAQFGADVAMVGSAIQMITNGVKVGEYRPDDADDEIDIRVRFPQSDRNLERLDLLRVPTREGNIPISNFITRVPAQAVGTIDRTDMRRTLTITADLAAADAEGNQVLVKPKVSEIQGIMATLDLDPRVNIRFRGGNEEQDETMGFLAQAMLGALALMAIILVTQFNSLFQASLILTAVIFSTGGVLLGHLVVGIPFGIVMGGVGTIALAGIVVNNNIVLIDTYNHIRRTAPNAREAILRTCAQRLRPVMLTTVTTILGLMPMVLGINLNLIDREVLIGAPGSTFWEQMASAVAGGLAFATVLTMVLTPSLLMIQANYSRSRQVWRQRKAKQPIEAASTS